MRGYRLQRDEPAIGLLETDWKPVLADALADKEHATDKNGQANWRERLRLRIEPADQAGRTEVFLTQHHSQRVTGTAEQTPKWELRPSDADRAVEMLNRLARHLAAENVQDAVPLKALLSEIKIDADGHTVLQLATTFDNAWRRTSLALDSLGFTIEDHDRASRIFHVYNELPSGYTEEELKFGKPKSATVREEYWLHVQERGDFTNLSVRNKAGQVDESQVARHLLNLLQGQLQ
jgi:outer membrane protein assembly factor BamC